METVLREVLPNLWVSDADSASVISDTFGDIDLVLDCTGRDKPRRNLLNVRPTGSTSHSWTVEDLDEIVHLVKAKRQFERKVLIHCQSGRSRSTCAAAAVLLALGLEKTVTRAIDRTKIPGTNVNTQSLGGLKKWWGAKLRERQISLFEEAS